MMKHPRDDSIKNIDWTEKYRPRVFDDVLALPPQLKEKDFVDSTHLLFVGKAGVGKTTCARIIAKMVVDDIVNDYKELNASDDRGIQVVRDKIVFFVRKSSFSKRKVLLLDEADHITNDAQACLRGVLENYSSSTLFILTANYLNRIIEPIRSRCTTIQFTPPSKEEILIRLAEICAEEGVQATKKDLQMIIDIAKQDVRKSIKLLQMSIVDGKVDVDNIQMKDEVLDAIWMLLQRRNYKLLRELLQTYSPDYQQVYSYLWSKVFELDISRDRKKQALLVVADRMWKDAMVANPEINFIACCIELERYV